MSQNSDKAMSQNFVNGVEELSSSVAKLRTWQCHEIQAKQTPQNSSNGDVRKFN